MATEEDKGSCRELTLDEVKWQEDDETLLGRGTYSSVYKGKFSDRDVAVKVMDGPIFKRGLTKSDKEMVRKEANVMWRARSPYVVDVIGYIIAKDPNTYAIVMEFMEKGMLRDIIIKGETTWNQKKIWITHIAEALNWLHNQLHLDRIVHGDVKMENVLINKDKIAKLADFGISKLYHSQTRGMSTSFSGAIGTPFHIAPELFKHGNSGRNEKTDVYSFGITVYMIYSNCKDDIFSVSQACPVCDETIQLTSCDDKQMKRIIDFVKNSCLCEIQRNRKGFKDIVEELKREGQDEIDAELYVKLPTEETGEEKMNASGDNSLSDELQKMKIMDSVVNQVPPDTEKAKTVINNLYFKGGENVQVGDVYNVTNSSPASSRIPGPKATDKFSRARLEILTHVGGSLSRNWKEFFRSTKVLDYAEANSKLTEIEHRNPRDLTECGHEAVVTWYNCSGIDATYASLIAALERIRLKGVADEVKNILAKHSMSPDSSVKTEM